VNALSYFGVWKISVESPKKTAGSGIFEEQGWFSCMHSAFIHLPPKSRSVESEQQFFPQIHTVHQSQRFFLKNLKTWILNNTAVEILLTLQIRVDMKVDFFAKISTKDLGQKS
jgi:hypothetical protein